VISLRALRRALSIALLTVASGLPAAAFALLDDDCCAERCDAPDGKRCPPGCTQLTCAKVFSTALPPALRAEAPPARRGKPQPVAVLAPALPLVSGGVFHPPRA
jgi:hypothetical protein